MRKTNLVFIVLAVITLFCESAYANSEHPLIGGYNVYYGNLHNHSTISDGSGTPAQAYAYAKDVAKLDFFSLADHESFPSAGEISTTEWADMKNQANLYNVDGSFVTFTGFEWTNTTYGHVAVIGSDDIALSTDQSTNTFSKLKTWLSTRECIAFFNHPGSYNGLAVEFDHFAAPISDKFVGMELWNKQLGFSTYYYNNGYFTNDNNKSYYDEALALGWKIGASGAGDHHGTSWGTSENFRMAILSNNLTRTDILSALKARRFYSTLDKNIALSFKIGGQEMGSTVGAGSQIFHIQALDTDLSDKFTEVVLFDKNHNAKQTWNLNTSEVNINTTFNVADGDYYYVKIKQADGDEAISSPIWIETSLVATTSAETIGAASNAIDNNTSTMWSTAWNRNNNPAPVWLQLDYGTSRVYNQFSITFNVTTSVGRAPQDFKIQGSNNGGDTGTWVDLSTQTAQVFASGETKIYSFTNSTAYRYYRLYITAANTTSAIEITEVAFSQLITDTEKPTPPRGLSATNLNSSSFTLNWSTVSTDNIGVIGYEAYNGSTLIGSFAGYTNSMSITGLTPNTVYNVVLLAKDAAGNKSDDSQALEVTTTNAVTPVLPIVTASNESLPAANAIDGLSSTNWKAAPIPTVAAPHWLQLQYPTPQTFNKVTLTSCAYNSGEGYSSRDPRNWTIEGSNDASSWTILDTQNFSTANPAYCWAPKDNETQHEVSKQFSFTNTTAYTYYRIKITENNQASSSVMLAEIAFSGAISEIEENNISDKISIYALSNNVIVDLGNINNNSRITIYDMKGVNINSILNRGNKKVNIEIKNKGIYFVQVQNEHVTCVQKVMIK